ncbi:ATP-dependent helicase [Pseudomonas sp. LFM046]|uniref:UvrD-helicase domain-containing protein n=1 Tax=Pseudomonas sp. LFM046 TaxID=1608357 RepID=UPI0005CFB487|nr:ATP-dependent helicase [Pseudomonas sp. LFM046]
MAAQLNDKRYSNETCQVLEATNHGKNFLLSGGAGSGKTYSLIETISGLLHQNPLARVACITYTNAATREIEHRSNNENLHVSTIHDFLWSRIKHFQKELKETLIDLINDDDQKLFKVLAQDGTPEKFTSIDGEIEYKDYLKLRDGVISHDQVIILAHAMFSRYKKLCQILNDTFQFILVDEYQDTNPLVVDILLEHLSCNKKRNIVGFFGDAMQSIYDEGIGNLDDFKGDGKSQVTEIKKEQNRRNPTSVINLANKIRTDGLKQSPSDDNSAPNMEDGAPITGSAIFIYSSNPDLQKAREYLDWDPSPLHTKELNLTHNLIASKAGFPSLMRIYDADKILEYVGRIRKHIKSEEPDYLVDDKTLDQVIKEIKAGKTGKEVNKVSPTPAQEAYINEHPDIYQEALSQPFSNISSIYIDKDMLIDDQKADQSMLGGGGTTNDHLIKHLHRIQKLIQLYTSSNFNDFMRSTDFKIRSHADKVKLKHEIEELSDANGKTIGEMIDLAHVKGLVRKDDRLDVFQKARNYIYKQVRSLPYSEFKNLYDYIDGQTPFSTQHKTKGREYDNVLVTMDNGRWNKYNFESFFTGNGKDTVISRTSKIVYVCCTRARRNLAFFYPQPSLEVIEKAKAMFGKDYVIDLDAS